MRSAAQLLFSAFAIAILPAVAWYLPGSAPQEYEANDQTSFKVNVLKSVQTQVPYRYYDAPFCPPPAGNAESTENLGEILTGSYIEDSPYFVKFLNSAACQVACKRQLNEKDKTKLKTLIDENYYVDIFADNLPGVWAQLESGKARPVSTGIPVGFRTGQQYSVLNHINFLVRYHRHTNRSGQQTLRIVGFELQPASFAHAGAVASCDSMDAPLTLDSVDAITYSYSVKFDESSVVWGTRWDPYLKIGAKSEVHWFSLMNSLMIVLFLSGMTAMILLRTLLRDIARYNNLDNIEEAQEESGWKLVHGDVFRKPTKSQLLSVCVGSGVQILGMAFLTLVFACFGFLSPANRGALLQALLLLFTFMGFPAGYVSARFNKLFEGGETRRSAKVTLLTALLFPGISFTVFFLLNTMLWAKRSTGAVPVATLVLILVLWFGISLPLVFVGSYLGYRRDPISLPVRTNQIPRQILPQPWTSRPIVTCLVGGILPFGAVFTELLFILSSLWLHQVYYLFGFLLLVLVILVVICAEISIAMCYFQLTSEDYRWMWRSFWTSASSAFYVFLYTLLYFHSRLNLKKFVAIALYFGYMGLMSYAFFLLTGAVGFISTFLFVRAIYGSIKVD
eukprot:GHVU01016432.1.p1 GENE.GHVU01016432.1~~GHVU01016432.1.p1  ORF type:complete len:620 (+),score=131.83 GHVU01016432.1:2719-4578(+)